MVKLKALIHHLPVAIFVIDRERRILLANQLAEELFSTDREDGKKLRLGDMLGCTNADNSPSGCGFSGICQLCRARSMLDWVFAGESRTAQFDADIKTPSKEIRNFKMTISPIHPETTPTSTSTPTPKVQPKHCIISVMDITEVRKQERLAAATETIGAICHEMNQPLQAIMGNVELLAQYPLEDGAHLKIRTICKEIERIKSITKQLMGIIDYQSKPYLSTRILDIEKSASKPSA